MSFQASSSSDAEKVANTGKRDLSGGETVSTTVWELCGNHSHEGLRGDVGLDLPAFAQCVASGTYQAAVQQDVEDGARAGVTGTPAFFINGRLVSGAQPLESFTRVIEEELARAR